MLSTLFQGQDGSIRRRATSMKQFRNVGTVEHQLSIKKSATLSKRNSVESDHHSSLLNLFFDKRRSSTVPDDPELAMALLDNKIAKIRGDLEAMKMEDRTMGQRVANVTAAVNKAASKQISPSNSLESIKEGEAPDSHLGSTTSLPLCDSKRDSGFIYDPAFEMIDPQKYCVPNNLVFTETTKKAYSTSDLNFIKNDFHGDNGDRLKARSIDRLSCYSDSALLAYRTPNF